MKFSEYLEAAQNGDEKAMLLLIQMYQPLITKLSFFNGEFDEDLYQEQLLRFTLCVKKILRIFSGNDSYLE